MSLGRHSGNWLCALATLALSADLRAQERAPDACKLTMIGTATVTAALDGRTLALADGRTVRLAGIERPAEPQAAAAAMAALAALAAGRDVTLKRLGAEHDRYGRVPAYVFAGDDPQPLQRAMLANGHARMAALIGDAACAADLRRAEQAARDARLGVWADRHYVIKNADQPATILAERGRLTLVEGRVLSVRESGGTVYVNFGRRWSEDFTVTISRRNATVFAAAGVELKKLSGRHVRVRGVVEERGGPWIEAIRPEQIEVIERN